MLKTIRCSGLRGPRRNVHCAHALTAAIQTVGADPSANSAQKLTACDNDRFDWLRPSGSSIFALDVRDREQEQHSEQPRMVETQVHGPRPAGTRLRRR